MAKDFDMKKFLLHKGERVGLWVAVGLMALLLIFGLFMPGKGVFSGSPSANAADLAKKSKDGEQRIASAAPSPDLDKIDPELLKKGGTFVLLDPDPFREPRSFFVPDPFANTKRLAPDVLTPVEFRAAVAMAQLKTYIFGGKDGKQILALIGTTLDKSDKKGQRDQRNFIDRHKKGGGPTFPGGGPGMGSMGGHGGGPTFPGGGPGMGSMAGPPGMGSMGAMGQDAGGKEGKPEFIDIDKAETLANGKLADNCLPLRMALVAGAFPYKKQLEEFQRALKYRSPSAVYNDDDVRPQFLGFNVERRSLLADGKFSEWAKLNLQKDFGQILFIGGQRIEKEDPKIEQVIAWSKGLAMPRPEQLRDDQYPQVERSLKGIQATLNAIEEAGKAALPPKPASKLEKREGFDVFNPAGEDDTADPTKAGGMGMVGAAARPGDTGKPTGSSTYPMANEEEVFVPEYVLVRFLDVTIKPGETYEYRIQIRMANPNYNRFKEVAYPELAKDAELKPSKFVPVSEEIVGPDGNPVVGADGRPLTRNLRVSVPTELHYYAVDQKLEDKKFQGVDLYVTNEYKDKAAVQIHRQLDYVAPDPADKKTVYPSGEWTIADRVLVNRGEYIGRMQMAEVPIWMLVKEDFILAANLKRNARDKRIEVYFGTEAGPPDEALLVDFDGGKVTYLKGQDRPAEEKRAVDKVESLAPVEMLILSPEGKLVLHDSVTDTNDEVRKKHHTEWEEHVKKAKADTSKGPSMTKPPGSDLFDPNKKGG